MKRETKRDSKPRATEIVLERGVLESDVATIERPGKGSALEIEGLDALPPPSPSNLAPERRELAELRAGLARDRERLARERAAVAQEFARFDRTVLEAVEKATATRLAELERDRQNLDRDREQLSWDRAALEDDRRQLERDLGAHAADVERASARPDPTIVEADLEAKFAARLAELEDVNRRLHEEHARERADVEKKLKLLEEARALQSRHAHELMEQEDALDIAHRRLEEEHRKLDDVVHARLKKSIDRALAGERARLENAYARVAKLEAELQTALAAQGRSYEPRVVVPATPAAPAAAPARRRKSARVPT